jgi:hypothetical protein
MPTVEQDKLLSRVAFGAERVLVKTASGEQKYRLMPGVKGEYDLRLRDDDEIILNKSDVPVVMKAKPGRKKAPKRAPKDPMTQLIVDDKAEHLKQDPLLNAVHADPEGVDVLHEAMKAIVTECASLEFQRIEADRKGEDSAMISNRRIAALTKVGDTWLRRYEQISTKGVDMESQAFQNLFSYILETFKDVLLDSGISGETMKVIFSKLGHTLEDESWKAEAKTRIKS